MALNVRFDGDLVVLSRFGGLVNDPRHFDAGREVQELVDQGYRHFVLDLAGLHGLNPTSLGLLTTITRLVRRDGGDAVLASVDRATENDIETMRMDSYWEIVDSAEAARRYFPREEPPAEPAES
jgi:anti-anti-sigma factor